MVVCLVPVVAPILAAILAYYCSKLSILLIYQKKRTRFSIEFVFYCSLLMKTEIIVFGVVKCCIGICCKHNRCIVSFFQDKTRFKSELATPKPVIPGARHQPHQSLQHSNSRYFQSLGQLLLYRSLSGVGSLSFLKLTTVVTLPLASTVILIASACGLDPTQVPTSSAGNSSLRRSRRILALI